MHFITDLRLLQIITESVITAGNNRIEQIKVAVLGKTERHHGSRVSAGSTVCI